ncbi:MAG: DUF4255 domain-containing protein [Oscillospiraceae bacterium]|jgi:hypothetical protein|nr:DUF4255 domain-containing protein [Oscillospiraceae bacterium]
MLSDITQAILSALRAGLPPLLQPGQIGLRSPADMDETCLLGVFPYSLVKDARYQLTDALRVDGGKEAPPLCAEMRFMVTSYAGKKSGLADDYKVLERVMRLWTDIYVLPFSGAVQPAVIPAPRIELLSPDEDRVSKIWQFSGTAYRLSLFYRCAPIAVASQRFTPVARVGAAGLETRDI